MGSYCELRFDDKFVDTAKSIVPAEFRVLFQEDERQVRRSADGEFDEILYVASKATVLERLDLLGYTSEVAEQRLSEWIISERKQWLEYISESGNRAKQIADAIESLTTDEWAKRIPDVIENKFSREQPIDEIDHHMIGLNDDWLWFDGPGSLVNIRALLEACPDVETVSLEVTDLIQGGWIDENQEVCAELRQSASANVDLFAPIVIIGEGHSDIEVLRNSLSALFPEVADFFSFFDHSELNVDGGADYLVKFLKAFAASRAPLRMIAIFDNDTKGVQAFDRAKKLNLPDNIMVMRLPDIDLARSYPTVGPQGEHSVNVNGQATSIELYLGADVLAKEGQFRPVRWSGYVAGINAYQGEIEGKKEVVGKFLADVADCDDPVQARKKYPELVQIWEDVFSLVINQSSSVQAELSKRFSDER